MNHKNYILFIFSFFCFVASAQQEKLVKIDSLLAKSKRLLESDIDFAFHYAFSAAERSEELHSPCRLAKAYEAIANAYSQVADADNTIIYFEKGLEASRSCNDKKLTGELTLNLASANYSKGSYDKAELLYRTSKKIAEQIKDPEVVYQSLAGLGYIYTLPDNYKIDSVRYYFSTARNVARLMNDSLKIAETTVSLGRLYERNNEWQKGFDTIQKALAIYERKNNLEGMTDSYKALGDLCWRKGSNEKAIDYYNKAYEYGKKMNSATALAAFACDLAYMHGLQKNARLLDRFALESYTAALHTKSWRTQNYVGKWLSKAYELTGNKEKALFYHKLYFSTEDSINNRLRIEKTSRADIQIDFEKKIAEMKMQEEKQKLIAEEKENNEKNTRNILIIGLVVSVLILLFIAYRNYMRK